MSIIPSYTNAESLADISKEIMTASGKREAIELQLKAFNDQVKYLDDQVKKTDAEISSTKTEIENVHKELVQEQGELAKYLSELYLESQVSFFEKLFRSRSLSDFMDQTTYLETIQGNISKTVNVINDKRSALEQKKDQLGELQVQNALAKASLEKQLAEKQAEFEKATAEEQLVRGVFALKLAKQAPGSYCKSSGKPVVKAKYPLFSFPVDCGYVSQGFGMTEFASIDRVYNGKIHNGVDVGVDTGAPIFAIGKGVVYAKGASPSGGWGNWLMIKHDPVKIDGKEIVFYSLYGHMVTESTLKVGKVVKPGTPVGAVGGTPYWAPHLHLSLFVSDSGWADNTIGPYPGNVVDPLDYMDIPISTQGTDWDPNYLHL